MSTHAAAYESRRDLRLRTRRRIASGKPGEFRTREESVRWAGSQTALIICDMWDLHHCKNATDRVGELVPRMNQFITKAREQEVLIVHAPSSCMKAYDGTPARQRAQQAPRAANLPSDIGEWCNRIPSEEAGKYPIDQADGGCDTPSEPQKAWADWLKKEGRNPGSPWLRQVDGLTIDQTRDVISDSGPEIWNLLEHQRRTNVLILGVHTNMCVLGRPFGLRQMSKNGKNTLLVRDLTDTMYNPASWPHVSHFQGTQLIIEHIEKFVCATTTSSSLLGGKAFRFREDPKGTA